MKLSTINGQLRLRSVYKLFFTGWVLGVGSFMFTTMILVMLVSIFFGPVIINGEEAQGFAEVAPMFLGMLIVVPIVIVFHAAMFGGLLTFGIWLYRLNRPILIIAAD